MGYFRAQPLDLGIKKKRRQDPFVEDPSLKIDYKNPKVLRRFMSERGKVLSRRVTGLTATNQRLLTIAIRRAQQLALLPIVNK
ncbi:MAG: 30S ribosomal protein S18 [Deltaproteobacteria bacterium]|nr:30S ribosomal protein S18 [Deltaproteobacteria bacterium]